MPADETASESRGRVGRGGERPVRRAVLRVSAAWRRWRWRGLLSLVLAGAVTMIAAPAPRPSSFFGAVTVGGEAVAPGTPVSAWVGGVPFAETVTFEVAGEAVFRLDVPGDVAETAAVEGGVEGQEVAFRVGNAVAAEVAVWSDGTVARVDLSAAAGPDLAIAKDDGVPTADPGDLLTYTIAVTNHGPGPASGIEIEDALPVGTSFVSASDGGALSAGLVAWPPFDLAEGASATRTLTLEVATSFPAGTSDIANTASVLDDGAAGLDPDLTNNAATDTNALAGGPDLVVGKSTDLAAASPGSDVVYTLTLENRGFQPALGVVLADTLPAEVLFLTASDDGRAVGGVVTWPAVDVAIGEAVSRTVRVRVPADLPPEVGELVNLAEAPLAGDLQPADNAFTHVLPVAQEVDLAVLAVTTAGLVTDLQSLAVSGEVAVELANLGNGAAAGFDLAVFEDRDGDEAYTAGADALLGSVPVALVAPGETATFAVPVAGTVLFRDNRVFAFADAGDVLAELDETNNVSHSGHGCQAVPPPGAFSPVVELSWPLPETVDSFSADSLSTPLVVQLTDDNGDGRWDERDVPDLVFVTYDLSNPFSPVPRLRAIRGDTGADLWSVLPPISGLLQTFAFSGLAAGDLDLDGRPEIVVSMISIEGPTGRPNRIAAYEHTGAFKWISPSYSTHPDGDSGTNSDNPTIADLDGDGRPEVVVGAHVFEGSNGALRWRGTGGQAYQSGRNADGLNAGAISIVADLDLDGVPEVVTGNTAYRADGSIYWQVPMDDGYPAVGDFDGDGFPEVVVVARGRVRLHEHDGTLVWSVELPGTGAEPGGAPTVANVDDDPEPEIGVAGSTQYVVFEADGSIKWQSAIQDGSSGFTGSTVFDLDGDGRFEVIYRDETALRIYRGEDGVVLYELPLSSVTLNEQPVVADVDRDGNAEIVVTSDRRTDLAAPVRTRGLRVIGDAGDRWVAARPVWNQHAYHIGNVAEDGHTVPAREEPSWLTHNTYRANVAPAAGAFASPDLTASRLAVDLAAFPTVRATVRVGNGGTTLVAAGLRVAFYDADPTAGGALLGVATVPHDLDPGAFADVALDFAAAGLGAAELFVRADDDGTGAGAATECDEVNNLHGIAWDTDPLGLALDLEDGTDAVQPGEVFTYHLTVANGSPFARTGVSLAHTLSPHVAVVAASDGGAAAGGVVTWPPFELAGTAVAVRTLTLEVDPALPLGVAELTNAATVSDDGGHGPDPTPANNTDTDTNRVLTVRAEAGGPYAGDEGAAISFDGSASSDRDGTVVAWEWDFDGDGVFEASGVTASHAFPDDGVYVVSLRVTDDSGEQDVDTAEVTVANLPPVVEAGPDQSLVEGDAATLVATTITDPGTADTHTATIDWGDGTPPSAGVVDAATGSVAGGHDYPDDGVFPVIVCATDDDGATACDGFTVTVANAAPVVAQDGDVDLSSWQVENVSTSFPGVWQVASDGLSVLQAVNAEPTFFVGDFLATGVRLEGKIRVETNADDDFIGFALGFQPGDTRNPEADFLLIDWKKGNQSTTQPCVGTRTMTRGLAVSRTRGLPQSAFYALHLTDPCDPAGPVSGELARGLTRGSAGWQTNVEYLFTIDLQPERLQVWVNGTLEFDLAGDFDFGAGRFAFYNFSQERVRYSTFRTVGLGLAEGQEGELRALFQDLGVVDTHTATIDWGDGTVSEAEVKGGGGSGTVSGRHTYLDDAVVEIEVCVEDDDGGVGCGVVPAVVANLPPVVDAGGDRLAYLGEGLTLAAAFTDAGVLDTHTATVDWGDGSVEEGAVSGGGGSGTVGGFHVYGEEGAYTVEVCVTDDDGGTGCDRFEVLWRAPLLDLALDKIATVASVRPGEPFAYVLTVRNLGTREPEDVVVTDVLPAHLDFVAASHGGAFEPATRTVTWTLPRVAFEAVVPLTLTVRGVAGLPAGETLLNRATVADDGRFGPDLDPTNDAASASVATWDGASPRVHLPPQTATEGVEHILAVRFDDALGTVAAVALPSDGLVAHWPFDDRRDPTLDASGNAHFATLGSADGEDANDPAMVCVSPLAPLAGNVCALDFTGRLTPASDDFVQVPAEGGLDFTGAYTISAWVRLDSTIDHRPLFVRGADDDVTDANDIEIYSQGSTRDLVVLHNRGNGGPLAFVGFRDPPAGRIFHLAVSFDGSEVRAYYDGVAQPITQHDAIIEPPLSTADVWLFGKVSHSAFGSGRRRFFDGLLDDVRFYGRALTPAEVQALAAATGGGESHSATVDWGDGIVESATVLPGGFVTASHLYPDDLTSEIEVCVTDSAGHTGCSRAPLVVENFVPVVVPSGDHVVDEGSPVTMVATFTDSGRADTHTATVDWRDGSTEPLPVAFDAATGTGSLGADHLYADDALYEAAVCVTDDDGGTGCGTVPILVRNVAPEVVAAAAAQVLVGEPLELAVTFTDPGLADTHTAVVDWGDGPPQALAMVQGAGSGSVAASHVYSQAGFRLISACVVDDDGGRGCDLVEVEVLGVPRPDLVVTAIDAAGVTTDPLTLAAAGTVAVTVANLGDEDVSVPFRLAVFDDVDGDGRFGLADALAGEVDVPALPVGGEAALAVPVAFTAAFAGDLLYAFADSAGEIAESDEENNVAHTGTFCEYRPPVGSFDPVLEWSWTGSADVHPTYRHVIMTPLVGDVSGDGVPDIVFSARADLSGNCLMPGVVRAISGDGSGPIWELADPTLRSQSCAEMSMGDIDGDQLPEILYQRFSPDGIVALEHTGEVKWFWAGPGGATAIANLDGEGLPEIIVGAQVLNADGTLRWRAPDFSPSRAGTLATVADLDLDGTLEITTGDRAWNHDGSLFFESGIPISYTAVGNFDGDDFPEIVAVAAGTIRLLEHDGTVKWSISPSGLVDGGPPTVADYDGDGLPEVGVAGASRYVVIDTDGTLLWSKPTVDSSSRITSSSVFDFEGDGRAEVVYNDHHFLRVYRGSDGTVLFQTPNSSCTATENPVVADVDGDGEAEIVVARNRMCGLGSAAAGQGIFVYGDASRSWVATRKVWNQHTYHVTNVTDHLTIPLVEAPSWLPPGPNGFRQQVLVQGNPLAAPDLTVSGLRVETAGCPAVVGLVARVGNGGSKAAPAGVEVLFHAGDPASGGPLLGLAATTVPLAPGEYQDVTLALPPADGGPARICIEVDPAATVGECNEQNVVCVDLATSCAPPELAVTKSDGIGLDRDGDGDVEPGDRVRYEIVVANVGGGVATEVALVDPIPAHTELVAGSVAVSQGTVTALSPLAVALGTLPAGATATVRFEVEIADPPPAVLTQVANQATVTSAELPPVLSDDPEAPGAADPTVTPVVFTPELTVDDVTVEEGAGEAVFTVRLSAPAPRPAAVDYATADGTAVAGEDYTATTGRLELPAGADAGRVAVPIIDDLVLEADAETFRLLLAEPEGVEIVDGEGVGTILDDELCPGPNLLVNPGSEERLFGSDATPGWTAAEGAFGRLATAEAFEGGAVFAAAFAASEEPAEAERALLVQEVDVSAYAERIAEEQLFAFTAVVRTGEAGAGEAVRLLVEYRDETGTAVLDAFDSGDLVSPAEWLRVTDVRLAPVGTRTVRVSFEATRFGDGAGAVWVDAAELRSLRTPALTVGDVTVLEGDAGTTDAVFATTLSCPYWEAVSVDFATADGLARAVADYLAAAGTLSFPSGETLREIAVPVVGDEVHELHEDFTVDLSNAAPATVVLADPRGTGLILNDDFCSRSPGFWKTHPELWPSDHLTLGGVEHGTAALAAFLDASGSDATLSLARQLVATKLNLLVGSDAAILPTVAAADAFLAEHPPGSNPRGELRQQANALKDALDRYNNLDCQEVPVVPE